MTKYSISQAAFVKSCDIADVERAIEKKEIAGGENWVLWDWKFHDWMPPVRPDKFGWFVNSGIYASKYILPLEPEYVHEIAHNYRKSLRGGEVCVTPVNDWNLVPLLMTHTGYYDGQLFSDIVCDELHDAMSHTPLVQIRVGLAQRHFDGKKPHSKTVKSIERFSIDKRCDTTEVLRCIEDEELESLFYRGERYVVMGEEAITWRSSARKAEHSLFEFADTIN